MKELSLLKDLGIIKSDHHGEQIVNPYYGQRLGLSKNQLLDIVNHKLFCDIHFQICKAAEEGDPLPWTILANTCAIANQFAHHRIRFGVGLSGGYQSSEDAFIFTCWEKNPNEEEFCTPEIASWIKLVYRLSEAFEPLDLEEDALKAFLKNRSNHYKNKVLKADCIEARLQCVGIKYVKLCQMTPTPRMSPDRYWERWDLSSYAAQTLWVFARSIQNYILKKGTVPDPEIRQFLIVQGKAKAGKSVLMSSCDRLFKSLGLNGGSLPNSNVFSNTEFAASNYALIDDADIATGKNRSINVLFTSAVIKSVVSGTGAVPYSMKNSSASVPIQNKILVIQNTNHVNLGDLVNADEGNLDRMRLLHIDRDILVKWFHLMSIPFDIKNIPGSYDALVYKILYSESIPSGTAEQQAFCKFDPLRYDLGQLIYLTLQEDPAMTIQTVLFKVITRFPDHYRIGATEEHGSLYAKLHPLTGDSRLELSQALNPIQALLARDPEFPVSLKQSATTWYALYQAAQKLMVPLTS